MDGSALGRMEIAATVGRSPLPPLLHACHTAFVSIVKPQGCEIDYAD